MKCGGSSHCLYSPSSFTTTPSSLQSVVSPHHHTTNSSEEQEDKKRKVALLASVVTVCLLVFLGLCGVVYGKRRRQTDTPHNACNVDEARIVDEARQREVEESRKQFQDMLEFVQSGSIKSSSPRASPRGSPRGSRKGTPRGSPRSSRRGTPRGSLTGSQKGSIGSKGMLDAGPS